MSLSKDDPWYVAPGHPHYRRALALSQMKREIERFGESERRIDQVAYRRRCLAAWPYYLEHGESPENDLS